MSSSLLDAAVTGKPGVKLSCDSVKSDSEFSG